METIVMAAIKTSSVNVASVLKPGRHKDVRAHLEKHGYKTGPTAEGFVTSEGRFVDRVEGKEIALTAGQIKDMARQELHSEDLW
jgi:hypothetical protein